ncbi:MAG: hypothetical protein AAF211_05295 [Myxococcota bacterium]
MRTIALISLTMAIGCGQDPYIANLSGNWVGTAVNAENITVEAEAQFRYDEEADPDRPFQGSLVIGGWIYEVSAATSDNKGASVELILNTEARACSIEATVDEDTMDASYSIDLCYAQNEVQDPALCAETGTLTLTK